MKVVVIPDVNAIPSAIGNENLYCNTHNTGILDSPAINKAEALSVIKILSCVFSDILAENLYTRYAVINDTMKMNVNIPFQFNLYPNATKYTAMAFSNPILTISVNKIVMGNIILNYTK